MRLMNEELQQRLDELEERIRALEARAGSNEQHTPARQPVDAVGWAAPQPPPPEWPSPSSPEPATAGPRHLELDSETVLKWGGVALVVLAVGFAVSTAISRGWIGPGLQLVGALALSFALIAVGLRLRQQRPGWTHALCSGGVLALFITCASDLFLDQADDRVALVATAASAAIGILLTVRLASEWVGTATLLGGVIGWSVIVDSDLLALTAAWVAVLVAAMIVVSVRSGWFGLRVAAHATAGISLVAIAGVSYDTGDERWFTATVVLVAAGAWFASLVRVPSIGDLSSVWQQLEVQLVIAAAPAMVAVVSLALHLESDDAIGVIGIVVAAVAAAAAIGIRRFVLPAHFASQVIGASVAVSIGVAVLLSVDATFAALAVQAAGLVVLSRLLGDNLRVLLNAAVLALIATFYDLSAMVDAWTDDVSVAADLSHLVIIVALAVGVWQTGNRTMQQLGALAVLVLTMIWTGSVLVHLPQGQAAVSVSWALIGTTVLVVGAVRKMPEVGSVGLGVLAVTVAKLLTVDLQEVDTLWRAALFLAVGLALLRLGFLLPRLMGLDEPPAGTDERDDPTDPPSPGPATS